MGSDTLDERIIAHGKRLYSAVRDERPSLFDSGTWAGKVMEWAMKDERFKTQLFRFVDVFPALRSGDQLTGHIREYFGGEQQLPQVFTAGVKAAGMLGSLGGSMLGKALGANIRSMARQFVIGETTEEAVRNIEKLRDNGFACAVDLLGEAILSHEEADHYIAVYLELLSALRLSQKNWRPLGGASGSPGLDWGDAPQINIAVKPSALYCLADPRNFEGSVSAILTGLEAIVAAVISCRGFLCIDMESTRMKEITLEVYRRLKLAHPDYPFLGVAVQSYLRDTDRDLPELLDWAERQEIPIAIRLVKGAYWDFEIIRAEQNGWEPPVWRLKSETDAAFERQSRLILEHHKICHFACASHNFRSIAAVLEFAEELSVPTDRFEFQVLYGMAEPVKKALLHETGRVRLYSPYGKMVPGMGYLVRRLLENTSNESFLRKCFAEQDEINRLLENPAVTAERDQEQKPSRVVKASAEHFRNEPGADFTRNELREEFRHQLAEIRRHIPITVPLFINGNNASAKELFVSANPANPDEIIGRIHLGGRTEAEVAVTAARAAFPAWRDTPVTARATILQKAAAAARRRLVELAAWQVLEIGKQWDQAYADVAEAIDFLEFYSREAVRLAVPQHLGNLPGELNLSSYEPCGVAAVIAPWNFPLAISCGMTSAALSAGNCVVYKPASLTPVTGHQLVEIFTEAGIPPGVFNYLPGLGSDIGDYLAEHPGVDLIAFTGSAGVGLEICEKAARRQPDQRGIKRVICEMGGKNAVIIDDDADLDEAIPHLLQSAFGFQGQKCSACSRVIILEKIYPEFTQRFVAAAAALTIGPAEDPACFLGPVADQLQQQKILEYIETGKKEGMLLYESAIPAAGYYVPIVILGDVKPSGTVAQEEIFGPVLSLMRARDFKEALAMANGTRYALTGSVFSRSPANLELASREFRVGNLYLNRGCTGAMVERQPFGGFGLSGGGTKAGGSDYLLHFLQPRVVTHNTVRRGFAPNE
ncbi:1-pyrroline-5-carboxylate dehydrogenase [Geobacter sp. OR-1]|uniref:proline dehydrogenase family protein n=1 Tax=Geobacter sp. OR-1 TaxID=1266765 RepID=UPI0005432791|nr:proline dehydrogenase family protein [Geobacter sp. OR-1]GAM11609.1 1-pyrroline-5-carboxylate dehydrogenase [Geobacter sp. OR-1]